ncbi:MAG: DUF1127 domain-containing protein [Paracoccaceae bacterium]
MAALTIRGIVHAQHRVIFIATTAGTPRRTDSKIETGPMAQAERITAEHFGIFEGLRGLLRDFQEKRARRRLYRQTVRELSTLNARELADLGIHPTMIQRLAHEAAYGA